MTFLILFLPTVRYIYIYYSEQGVGKDDKVLVAEENSTRVLN